MNYFDHFTPAAQRRHEADARKPKNEFDAARALKSPHAKLTEQELAQFIAASITQARRAKAGK
jgi:hypothetical protein